MSSKPGAPGKQQQKRLAAYLNSLARAAKHADRNVPLKDYCRGLMLQLPRKSVEPMAARLAPDNVRQAHQSLHHIVAHSPWSDAALLEQVRHYVLPLMKKKAAIKAWVVDDTGFPKKGKHSVGVARQYCGQLGKQDNCQVAVSLSVATAQASLPIAWRLYLPEVWAGDDARRERAGVPEAVRFQTKPRLSLDQIRQALSDGIEPGVVLADAAYGNDSEFRGELEELGLRYIVGIQATTTVWEPGQEPLPAKPYSGVGRPPKLLQRRERQQPVSARKLALELPQKAYRSLSWRAGTKKKPLRSRFAAVRVRVAHRDFERSEPHAEQWLLIEWPRDQDEPAKHRWIIERDYQELKQELGLGDYEGRGWRGFHHHATLCTAAYGFLVAERSRFSPSLQASQIRLRVPRPRAGIRRRGAPDPSRAASPALDRHHPQVFGS